MSGVGADRVEEALPTPDEALDLIDGVYTGAYDLHVLPEAIQSLKAALREAQAELYEATNAANRAWAENARLRLLLRRVRPELVPNHDDANRLAAKFGMPPLEASQLIEDIDAALAVSPPADEAKRDDMRGIGLPDPTLTYSDPTLEP